MIVITKIATTLTINEVFATSRSSPQRSFFTTVFSPLIKINPATIKPTTKIIPEKKTIKVLDAFAGDGLIWKEIIKQCPDKVFEIVSIDNKKGLNNDNIVSTDEINYQLVTANAGTNMVYNVTGSKIAPTVGAVTATGGTMPLMGV